MTTSPSVKKSAGKSNQSGNKPFNPEGNSTVFHTVGIQPFPPVKKTAHQIVDKSGKAYQTTVTDNIWPTKGNIFARHTVNNNVIPFITGEDYFANLMVACRAAETEICIAGWQINWDALLSPTVRLYDLLYEILSKKKTLKIYVMPWLRQIAVETYSSQAVNVFINDLNDRLGTKQIFAVLSPSYASINPSYYAHHQKQVVIDRKIAFVGGMDIAYGRFDDNTYNLNASHQGRQAMNRYNGCVEHVGSISESMIVDPDLLTGFLDRNVIRSPRTMKVEPTNSEITKTKLRTPGHWQPKYKAASSVGKIINAESTAADVVDFSTLDASKQPRMPWQDIHCRVEGPAVSDLLRNFVMRWNIEATGTQRLKMPGKPESYAAAGKMQVQVLRSTPANHSKKEYDECTPKPAGHKAGTQDNIHQGMIKLIEKSRRFIYIENQFFVSAFGQEDRTGGLSSAAQYIDQYFGDSQNTTAQQVGMASKKSRWVGLANGGFDRSATLIPPTNEICAKLIKRIDDAIMDFDRNHFHVYITLPVHSEGVLCNATVAVQVYWTMQTLVFGSHSLLNGIRRSIKKRELKDAKDENWSRELTLAEVESIPIEKCFDYVTLLNLRNWDKIGGGRYVTEQVYVHSKLMIVDDMYAIIGSANVNDRSLLGERDSELAVMVIDDEGGRADINGAGSDREVRLFAYKLRMTIWQKLFGISGGVRPATGLEKAIKEPGKPDSWRLIQKQAQDNAELYEAAFPWVAKSWTTNTRNVKVESSILPTWDKSEIAPPGSKWGAAGRLMSPMPFDPKFWDKPQHDSDAAAKLSQIKGFITALPIMWSKGENNRFEFPTALVADADLPESKDANATRMAQVQPNTLHSTHEANV